jgi:hypothetical protein
MDAQIAEGLQLVPGKIAGIQRVSVENDNAHMTSKNGAFFSIA